MAKARAITKRRKAVRNIRKITQTMQLIATARFQRCLNRATAGKPYTEKLTEMIQTLSAVGTVDHPLLHPNPGVPRSILLVITSNRGLCGAYNAAVLRLAVEQRKGAMGAGGSLSLEVAGKKGIAYLKFLGLNVEVAITDVEDRIAYARVAEIAERFMRAYQAREIARVDVAYMRFLSVGVQRPAVVQLLPIEPPAPDSASAQRAGDAHEHERSAEGTSPAAPGRRREFEFSPPPEQLLARLIPQSVKARLYQIFNDAIVSEQVARMVAMKSATDAAGDMIKFLTRQYNRARQTQITLELADIVGGAEAVK
jgi:F-type H+-transporting ATPase subunit gamma